MVKVASTGRPGEPPFFLLFDCKQRCTYGIIKANDAMEAGTNEKGVTE